MRNSAVRFCLAALLFAGLTLPALADGLPVPWPKKASSPVLQPSGNHAVVVQKSQKMVADGSPVPWPKKAINRPVVRADGSPVPWPKKSATADSLLLADGSPVPWPKK